MVGIALGVAGGVAGIWLGTSTALAGPINLKHVPADARTVIHVDVEAATGSIIGQFILEHGGELGIEQLDHIIKVEQEMGLDPLEDISDATGVCVVYDAHEVGVVCVAGRGGVWEMSSGVVCRAESAVTHCVPVASVLMPELPTSTPRGTWPGAPSMPLRRSAQA